MGRPAWAADDQWAWLKDQATAYALIKGTNATTSFWPTYLKEWARQWPVPALDEVVRLESADSANDGNSIGTDDANDESAPNAAGSSGDGDVDDLALNAGGSSEDSNAASTNSVEAPAKKKKKKPLTWELVSSLIELRQTGKTELTH
jgi:hypothetical protein